MLFIPTGAIYRTEEFMVPTGGHMLECPRCGQLQPHLLLKVMKREVAILILRKEWETGKLSMCEVCHGSTSHRKGSEIQAIERWSAASEIQDYSKRAGVASLPADYRLITPASAEAMLQSVTAMSAVSVDLNWKDYAVALLVFLVAGVAAVGLFAVCGNQDNGMWLLLGLPFGGLFLALGFLAVTQHRKRARNHHLGALLLRLMQLGVTIDEVLAVMPQQVLRNDRIYTLLKPFM